MPFKPQQALLPRVTQGGTLLRIALAVCWDAGRWIIIFLTSAPSPRPCVCWGLLKNRLLAYCMCVCACMCALKMNKAKMCWTTGKSWQFYHGQKSLAYLISQLIYQGIQQFIRIIKTEDQRPSGISFPITLEEIVFNKKKPVTNIDHLKSRFLVCITENFEKPFQTLPSW